ncbi:hypothetical protein [Candidatus Ruminimicrobium bovinum]|uniref:hypothetical protein n=1 Tax=Candidatus Ruminimicrobium bovinum TaxID=3242779 RepID=UPI0039B9BCF6
MDFINFLYKEKQDRQKIINFFIDYFEYVKFEHIIEDIENECNTIEIAIEENKIEEHSEEYKKYKDKKNLCEDIKKILNGINNEQ